MAENENTLHEKELEEVTGGRKKHRHSHHLETRAFLKNLFNRNRGEDVLGCENPKHKQKQG